MYKPFLQCHNGGDGGEAVAVSVLVFRDSGGGNGVGPLNGLDLEFVDDHGRQLDLHLSEMLTFGGRSSPAAQEIQLPASMYSFLVTESE
ncbi:unnamed protein product, partial [Dibothriocephalus latus]